MSARVASPSQAFPTAARPLLVIAGVGASGLLRTALAGPQGAASLSAAAVFALLLLGVGVAAGWRPGRLSVSGALLGLLGALVLVAAPLVREPTVQLQSPQPFVLEVWAPVVTLVAVAEEVALRGALFTAVCSRAGAAPAVAVAAIVFALLHVPLYGWVALPLDLAVGVWLGVLRLVSGGVLAPALAHALADLSTAWVI